MARLEPQCPRVDIGSARQQAPKRAALQLVMAQKSISSHITEPPPIPGQNA
jgi:hypothetical protein